MTFSPAATCGRRRPFDGSSGKFPLGAGIYNQGGLSRKRTQFTPLTRRMLAQKLRRLDKKAPVEGLGV